MFKETQILKMYYSRSYYRWKCKYKLFMRDYRMICYYRTKDMKILNIRA